jgi:hypothetical protein
MNILKFVRKIKISHEQITKPQTSWQMARTETENNLEMYFGASVL